jgi:PAS domain S-box-containing protein
MPFDLHAIFPGESTMARRCRAHAWERTPLGRPASWPVSLVAVVRLILSAHHPMMVTWGPGYAQLFNDAFLPIVGGGPRLEAALGADARQFWGPTWAAAMPNIEAVLHGGTPVVSVDQPIPLERDGRLDDTFMTYSVSPLLADDGATAGLLILVEETTARVRAAAETARRERELQIITEMARLGGWVVDLRSGVCHWSDEVCTLHEMPSGTTLTAEDGVRWFAPEHRDAVRAAFERAVTEGTPYALEVQIVTASGNRRWVRTSGELVRDGEGRPHLVRGTLQDIEVQHAADARVREQAALLDLASDAIIVHDLQGTVLYWNAGAERMFGYAASEVVGRSAADVNYQDAPIVGEAVRHTMQDGTWAGELSMHRRDGSPLVFDSRWTLVRDAQGAPYRLLAIGTDATERKQLLQQFLRAQRMESIGTLAGGIAHDLNNVLAPILMSIELLRLEIEGDEGRELLDTLYTSATRGAGMVQQILTFARGVDGEKLPVELRHIVRDVARVVRDTFPKAVTLTQRLPADLWAIEGNPTQFHQVLMNLVVNARDAMPQGGTITVQAENVDVDEQYAAMAADAVPGRYVRLTVSDTGEGMAPEVLDRIFEPFFTTKPVGQGTGLGIPTTLGIVRAHGGFMTVYSDQGKGTVFKLYFPATAGETKADAVDAPVVVPRGAGQTVLLVDDDHGVLTVAAATLEAYGYRVAMAKDGADALAQFRTMPRRVALVVTDITMPVMDGPATMRAIRELDAAVPFVVMSGLADVGERHLPPDIPVARVLAKPFTATVLLRAVHESLRPVGD